MIEERIKNDKYRQKNLVQLSLNTYTVQQDTQNFLMIEFIYHICSSSSFSSPPSSFYWVSVGNAPNVLQPYWLIVLPLDLPDLTASLLL